MINYDKEKIVYAVDTLPSDFDSIICGDYTGFIINSALAKPLFKYNESIGAYSPYGVKSFSVSNDKLCYDFEIDHTIFFSDGCHVTANDYKDAFLRILTYGNKCPIYSLLQGIKNWGDVCNNEIKSNEIGIICINDYTLRIELDFPINLLELLSTPYISPLKKGLSGTIITAGAFSLLNIDAECIILEKNYFFISENEFPKFLEFRFVNDMYKAISFYEDGEIDITCNTQFPYELIEKFSLRKDFYFIAQSGLSYALWFKNSEEKLKYSNVINRDEIGLSKYLMPRYSFFGLDGNERFHKMKEYVSKKNDYSNDFAKKIELLYAGYYPNEIIARKIKNQIEKKTSTKVQLKEVSLLDLVNHINDGKFEMALDIMHCFLFDDFLTSLYFSCLLTDEAFDDYLLISEKLLKNEDCNNCEIKQLFEIKTPVLPLLSVPSVQLIRPNIHFYRICKNGYIDFDKK